MEVSTKLELLPKRQTLHIPAKKEENIKIDILGS